MSRLDRFLISLDWAALYPDVLQKAPLKLASDHCPILLDSRREWWCPAPFRFELMWLEEAKFPDLIRGWWKDLQVSGWEGFRIVTKLKKL